MADVRMQLGSAREYLECKPARGAYDCQAGLTRSHIEAWKRLAKSGEPAAWIFEYEQAFSSTWTLFTVCRSVDTIPLFLALILRAMALL